MNTPDTEWEKEFDEGWARNNPEHPRIAKREAVKSFIKETLSSRDTYWKERVRKNVLKYSNQKFLEGNIVDPLELYEAITNEDNLK